LYFLSIKYIHVIDVLKGFSSKFHSGSEDWFYSDTATTMLILKCALTEDIYSQETILLAVSFAHNSPILKFLKTKPISFAYQ